MIGQNYYPTVNRNTQHQVLNNLFTNSSQNNQQSGYSTEDLQILDLIRNERLKRFLNARTVVQFYPAEEIVNNNVRSNYFPYSNNENYYYNSKQQKADHNANYYNNHKNNEFKKFNSWNIKKSNNNNRNKNANHENINQNYQNYEIKNKKNPRSFNSPNNHSLLKNGEAEPLAGMVSVLILMALLNATNKPHRNILRLLISMRPQIIAIMRIIFEIAKIMRIMPTFTLEKNYDSRYVDQNKWYKPNYKNKRHVSFQSDIDDNHNPQSYNSEVNIKSNRNNSYFFTTTMVSRTALSKWQMTDP